MLVYPGMASRCGLATTHRGSLGSGDGTKSGWSLIEQGRLSTACRRGRHSLQAGETFPFADPPGGRALDLVDRDAVVAGVGHEQPSGLAEPGIVRMGQPTGSQFRCCTVRGAGEKSSPRQGTMHPPCLKLAAWRISFATESGSVIPTVLGQGGADRQGNRDDPR